MTIASFAPLHFSQLKRIARSPMHYRYAIDSDDDEDTKSRRLGRAVDLLLTGSSGLLTVYDGERRGKKWAEFEASVPSCQEIITASEDAAVRGMEKSVRANGYALELLSGDHRQRTIEWEIAGRKCAGTPDSFTRIHVADLKTTRDADPRRFKWDARKLGYHAQLAWYRSGLSALGLLLDKNAPCYIVAVESSPPYPVVVYQLTESDLELGTKAWRGWFETLRTCEESNHWPGYSESVVPLDLPIFMEEE